MSKFEELEASVDGISFLVDVEKDKDGTYSVLVITDANGDELTLKKWSFDGKPLETLLIENLSETLNDLSVEEDEEEEDE